MEVHYVLEEGGESFITKIASSFLKSAKLGNLAITEHRGLISLPLLLFL